ncbi:RDD family protein [Helicobacter cappadocius]|uniref:RDD family protein n=1 Tax=Helicobacter cappadocius TaxID=3063998 RepID=A0AA90PL16_9HELI|nr:MULTISPECIES: RDD family protein [unclassified Helicobacter]MDO7252961.1 RDD family protein [Helicobacter sp. faydin-H75]MDP2539049.1 RDD family protein [Helicobacter sp. faydin-H76]
MSSKYRWRKIKNQKNISQTPSLDKKSPIIQTLKETYAFARIKAFITDMFMIYTPILYIITYFVLGSAEKFRHDQKSIFACVLLYGIISALFISLSSQTPGFRYMQLAIIRDNGRKVGFFRALIRFFIWIFGIAIFVGILTPFFRKDKKCLHDILCSTTIVKKPSIIKK